MNVQQQFSQSQNEADSENKETNELPSAPIVRPILSRTPITHPISSGGSPAGNGRVLPVVYLKMQQKEQVVPVVSSSSGTLISTVTPKISTAPSGGLSSTLSTNQPGYVTIQAPIRTVSQTSANQPSQPHIITLPKVANTALALSNQQLLALQSVSGSNQGGPVPQQQYVTIQAPIVTKTLQNSGGISTGQVQPQYVTIRTPLIAPPGSGSGATPQSQFVTIQAPVVQTSTQQTSSPTATFLPVSSVSSSSTSVKSPMTYQVYKSNINSGEKHIVYPVSVSNLIPSTQSKMIFTPVTIMPKVSVVSAGTNSVTVQSSSDGIGNTATISGLKINTNPRLEFATKLINRMPPNRKNPIQSADVIGNAATISGIKLNTNQQYAIKSISSSGGDLISNAATISGIKLNTNQQFATKLISSPGAGADIIGNTATISGITLNTNPQYATKLVSSPVAGADVIGNAATISGIKLNTNPQYATKIVSSPGAGADVIGNAATISAIKLNTNATKIISSSSSDVVGNAATISGIKINPDPQYSTKILNSSTVSLLQGKSIQSQTIRKEAVILPSYDKYAKTKVKLPVGVSVSNPTSTSPSTQGFINLTISNGHIQQSSPKGLADSSQVLSETTLFNDLEESTTVLTPQENLFDTTNLDDLLVSKAVTGKQLSGNSSEVIDIKSILRSGTFNDKNESFGSLLNIEDTASGQSQSEVPVQKSPSETATNEDSTNNQDTLIDDTQGPSSPINLFCEEGDITPSPPNEHPTPKYTITMPDDPDEDIKIQLVKSDVPKSEKDVLAHQSDESNSRPPPTKVFKPLLKKRSPTLLSKGNSSSKGQSLLRNPAALLSATAKTPKSVNNKGIVKSILKPQSSKKKQVLKYELKEEPSDGVGDSFQSSEDHKDSPGTPPSPLTPSSFEDFDAIAALEWKDGIGLLPGSKLKFRMNEFGLMEIMSDEEFRSIKVDKDTNSDSEGFLMDENSNSSIDTKSISDINKDKKDTVSDDVYCCETCNVYGLASEFLSDRFCTQACSAAFTVKKAWQYRREQDLRALRLRRKKRRLEQQRQAREKAEQDMKDEDSKSGHTGNSEIPGKSGSNLVSKLLMKFKAGVSESMSDGDDSLEDPMSIESPLPASPSPSLNASDKGSTILSERDSFNEDSGRKSLKQKSSSNFTWSKYLEMVKAKAAPSKLFRDPYPYLKNGFKVGMKLEGIDPEHQACYCVLTVAEVKGYRIRLHFDGYPENYDFWVNADSREIFQAGWCEKNLRRLTPPKGQSNFNWNVYLKASKATAAPKFLFSKTSASPVCPNAFRIGMKLEAVDRKNSSLVCVASIADVVDSRCLIHFDSWDDVYDYWVEPTSSYIHPVGWCEANGVTLTPPNQYKDPTVFSWEKYLKETKTIPAPARAFKQRPPCGFRRGMRLEAVDKRAPHLIRVATVDDVHKNTIRIRFDGWPDDYSYWVDDDNADIHPPGWCLETRHPLEAPLSEEDMKVLSNCGVPGCKGDGHVKGPKYSSHNTAQNCPYAPANILEDSHLPDRLTCSNDDAVLEEWPAVPFSDQADLKKSKRTQPPKWKRLLQDVKDREPKRLKLSEHHEFEEKPSLIASLQQKLQSELERSVVDPGYQIENGPGRPTFWAKHSKPLHESPMIRNAINPHIWSIEEVVELLLSIPCLEEYVKVFREQAIDGEALLMLTQNELVSNMKLKLGHAIRLYNCIVILRQKCS